MTTIKMYHETDMIKSWNTAQKPDVEYAEYILERTRNERDDFDCYYAAMIDYDDMTVVLYKLSFFGELIEITRWDHNPDKPLLSILSPIQIENITGIWDELMDVMGDPAAEKREMELRERLSDAGFDYEQMEYYM